MKVAAREIVSRQQTWKSESYPIFATRARLPTFPRQRQTFEDLHVS